MLVVIAAAEMVNLASRMGSTLATHKSVPWYGYLAPMVLVALPVWALISFSSRRRRAAEFKDPERRIGDLERQLGEQPRDASPPPVASDRSGAGSIPNADLAGRRFVVGVQPKAWERYLTVAVMLAIGVFALASGGGWGLGGGSHRAVVFGFALLVGPVFWWVFGGRKLVIRVTSDGLTISKRPGEVFPFRDAELGQWRKSANRVGPYVGRALFLTSGPQRFVLGDFKNPGDARQVPVDGPQVEHRDLDAWTRSSAFDELLAIVGPPCL
jgi:hypothetical protein